MFVALFIGKTVMRCLHVNATYSELSNGIYSSAYMKNNSDTLHIIPLNSPKFLHSDEFNYPRPRNNEGFRVTDFVPNLDTTKFLIQTYGDSFSEGDDAPMDSSYAAALRTILQQGFGKKIFVQNFGVCGSDPAFSFKQFQHIGLKLHPNIIAITYSSFDFIFDFFTRGGLERFGGEYLTAYRAPRWEILYAYSYIFRAIVIRLTGLEHRFMFVDEATRVKRIVELKTKWNQVFTGLANMAKKNKVQVLLLKKTERSEVTGNQYMFDFSFFEQMADTVSVFKRFNLLPYYRDSIRMDKNTIQNYYWKKDGHHNATGYAAMAKGVYCGLQKSYTEIFPILDSLKMKPE